MNLFVLKLGGPALCSHPGPGSRGQVGHSGTKELYLNSLGPSFPEVKSLSRVRLFATLQTITRQVPLSMEFPRLEYWSGLPFPSPGDLPDRAQVSHICRQSLYHLSQSSPSPCSGDHLAYLTTKSGCGRTVVKLAPALRRPVSLCSFAT